MEMHTLLIRLNGPMQSWGMQSRFTVRDTGLEPTKSGVLGLVCAAMGIPRTSDPKDLANLRFGVRVDREGNMGRDYHTTMSVIKASGKRPPKGQEKRSDFIVISNRYYLMGADFLVGLEGSDLKLLTMVHQALADPVWPLYLGRKSFPPSLPAHIPDGLFPGAGLESMLTRYPWPGIGRNTVKASDRPESLRLILETDYGQGETMRTDQLDGASFDTRRFAPRFTTTRYVMLGREVPLREEGLCF